MTQSADDGEWPAALTRLIGDRVRYFRGRRSGAQLAQDVTDLGFPYTRDRLTNLETHRRDSISVGELLALAEVLMVPPLALLVGPVESVPLLPERDPDPWTAYLWLSRRPTGRSAEMLDAYRRHAAAAGWVGSAVLATGSGSARLSESDPPDGWLATLVAVRAELRAREWALPRLPDEVARVVEDAERERDLP